MTTDSLQALSTGCDPNTDDITWLWCGYVVQ